MILIAAMSMAHPSRSALPCPTLSPVWLLFLLSSFCVVLAAGNKTNECDLLTTAKDWPWTIRMSDSPGNLAEPYVAGDKATENVVDDGITYDEVGKMFYGISTRDTGSQHLFSFTPKPVDLPAFAPTVIGQVDSAYQVQALAMKYGEDGKMVGSRLFALARLISSAVIYLLELDKNSGSVLNAYTTNFVQGYNVVDMTCKEKKENPTFFATGGTEVLRFVIRSDGSVRTKSMGTVQFPEEESADEADRDSSKRLTGIAMKPDGTMFGIDNQTPPNIFDMVIDHTSTNISIGRNVWLTAEEVNGQNVPLVRGATFQCSSPKK